jgi:hypothetical protein
MASRTGGGAWRAASCASSSREKTTTATAPKTLPAITIGWAGDAVPASSDVDLPGDPATLFAGVRAALQHPDLTFVNLEGTLTEGGGSSKCGPSSTNCYAFRAPPSYARAFRAAGVDVVAYPVDYRTDGDGRDFLPFRHMFNGMQLTDLAMKEWVGLVAYRLAGYTPELLPRP